jgi:uncharacterized protein
MFERQLLFSQKSSMFLFGARGTGKTHLLQQRFQSIQSWYIDLLNPDTARRYLLRPSLLIDELAAKTVTPEWIIIDEVQKVPALLDVVHFLIERQNQKFVLSGSSARKLRRNAANLLAGRAFVYHLFPLTGAELGPSLHVHEALTWGSLPRVYALEDATDKAEFLKAYANTYIKEEILEEQLVRNLLPFHRFLPIAAQMDGKIVNYASLARESGTTIPTIQNYFQILEDTLLGFMLPTFHESIRKRQLGSPKFYFFDNGVKRALAGDLTVELRPQTSQYGMAFEGWVINEIYRRQSYLRKEYRLSYLLTASDVEIDLIVERPGQTRAVIEIKSTTQVTEYDVKNLRTLGKDIPNSSLYCFSQDPIPKKFGDILCLPWQEGLTEIGLKE